MTLTLVAVVGTVAFTTVGCANHPSSPPNGSVTEGPFTITRVNLQPDGTANVESFLVTRQQIAAEAQASAELHSGGLTPEDFDAGEVVCGSASTRLYDNTLTGCQSGCNEICFNPYSCDNGGQNRNVYLGSYCHTDACTESWNGLVRSYWNGGSPWYLYRNYNDGHDGTESLLGTASYHNAGTYGQQANYLYFTNCVQ